MTDREEREEHIKRLEAALACEEKRSSGKCAKQTCDECDDNCALLYEQGNWGEWKETLRYAINSLKTDLKYDLMYEGAPETKSVTTKQLEKMYEDYEKSLWREHEDVRGDDMVEMGTALTLLQEELCLLGCWDEEVEE